MLTFFADPEFSIRAPAHGSRSHREIRSSNLEARPCNKIVRFSCHGPSGDDSQPHGGKSHRHAQDNIQERNGELSFLHAPQRLYSNVEKVVYAPMKPMGIK